MYCNPKEQSTVRAASKWILLHGSHQQANMVITLVKTSFLDNSKVKNTD